ncbi:MAG: multidrug transporter [Ruminococcaceae bacterium]|nr:multidrug transporter [Oscillospiraceae bacterium]
MLQTIQTNLCRMRQICRLKKGFGTLEAVIIIAVILSIALLFRKTLSEYATRLINDVFAGDPLAN